MKAIVTGASSGIGKDIAKYLASKNIDLVLVARRENELNKLKEELSNTKVDIQIYPCDLKNLDECKKIPQLFNDVDILINNAGFGDAGEFIKTNLDKELDMIDVNIKALHILFKEYLKLFVSKNSGHILNVASVAGFQPGPKMATYYATKAYVLNLSEAVSYELKKSKSKVSISVLCPGPVATEFNKVANVKFKIKEMLSSKVAKIGIDKMFKNKVLILPGFKTKLGVFFERFVPRKLTNYIVCRAQEKKQMGK